jgi:4-amino-4-deoxy-L-arabinose transferase-like glycosyltransferase
VSAVGADAQTRSREDTQPWTASRSASLGVYRSPLIRESVAIAVIALLADVLLLSSLPLEIRFVGALLLFVVLPGYLFVQAVFNGPRPGPLERYLLTLGSGYVLTILMMLALYALFRPLETAHVVAGASLLNGGLLVALVARRGRTTTALPARGVASESAGTLRNAWPALLLLAVAAPLRLYNLGHSEFQGDEALVLLRALALVQGVPDALIAHRKVPGEVLLNATFAAGLGSTTELVGRLPFALAGLVAILAFYRLGRAMFGQPAGLAAGLLLAVNGYFVAFGRILQYQSVGLLLDTLAILCLFRFTRESTDRRAYAVIGALLLAGSGLMGLNAVFLLPIAALALWSQVFGPNRAAWRDLAIWLWPLLLLIPSAVAVYFFRAQGSVDTLEMASAWRYLGPRMGGDPPYFNLRGFLFSASHYTSSLYLMAVLGAGIVLLLKALYERIKLPAQRMSLVPPTLGAALAWLAVDVDNLAPALLLAAAALVLVRSPRHPLPWRMALLWLMLPLFTHLFLMRQPGTHYREVFPGLALLVGAASAELYASLSHQRLRLAALFAGCVLLGASAHYVYVAWIQPWPEYQLLYPLHRHPLDWTNLDVRRAGGTFGAARHHGWKTVAELVAAGELPANYTTNERPAQAGWYLKRSWVCRQAAELLVRAARTPTDRRAIESGDTAPDYHLAAQIYVGGRPSLSLFTREPPPGGPRAYHAEDYGSRFDHELASSRTGVGRLYRPSVNDAPECPRAA